MNKIEAAEYTQNLIVNRCRKNRTGQHLLTEIDNRWCIETQVLKF